MAKKFNRDCDFCGKGSTNHLNISGIVNLYWCSDSECHRKFHCILSTLIPNKEYEVILKKRTKEVGKR